MKHVQNLLTLGGLGGCTEHYGRNFPTRNICDNVIMKKVALSVRLKVFNDIEARLLEYLGLSGLLEDKIEEILL